MARVSDRSQSIAERIAAASEAGTPLAITGSGSKAFYGRAPQGEALDVTGHRGIVNYDPTELVLTARGGTPLAEIETALDAEGQMLAFEPPRYGGGGTLGGAVAAGLSGPRRPFTGAVRDMMLGTRVANGRGEIMRFGGEVMKNVAGYDVSRLMAGSLGTLGVILEISLKVLPRPVAAHTVVLETPMGDVFRHSEDWLRRGMPLSATAHDGERLYVRLSGARSAVEDATRALGGERIDDAPGFWRSVRDHTHDFFTSEGPPLWRLALPPGAPLPALDGALFSEWAGKQLWLRSAADAESIRRETARLGGHATLFRGGDRSGEVFHPLEAVTLRLHRELKRAFDPAGVLNPGRLYPNL
ncbi:glycolate oxidase subunit GlcE [Sediminicurvatus halobius]|uniref:Glycolate oxidase subunit GlcE n=1 Tax=Sediminicurvatus halobius TaxID=2182432 RepID=A0A2U2N4Y4_9GAMM|nr:glycolate oxidase subunit GlcE [Spiribacter halobius]PWG64265.1 glycolate oxidase subunit GlcE [Spiribacter halobius]UEX79397.1 glycolate oxidase subunit GlcE [Spiribacter halobius]